MIIKALNMDFIKRPGKDYQTEIVSVSYSESGDSLGASYSIILYDGKITRKKQESANSKNYKKKRMVTEKIYREIENIAREYDIKSWTDLEKSDIFALDAPSTEYYIWFTDGTKITVNDNDIVPDKGYQALREIRKILEKAIGDIK